MHSKPVSEPSSLDRFLWDRGAALLGHVSSWRGGFIALFVNSIIQAVLGTSFIIAGQLWQDSSARIFQILGPIFLCGSLVLAMVSVYAKKRSRDTPRTEVKLSLDAMKLLHRIMAHIGWSYDQNKFSPGANQWNTWMDSLGLSSILGRKTSSQLLRQETFALLDAAAHQFNRANGVFRANKKVSNSALDRIVPSATVAADEAMIAIFNKIAVMEQTPESSGAIRKQIERDILNLRELADRTEALAGGRSTLTERYATTSAMQGVLEQLRYEADAREELNVLYEQPNSEMLDDRL